eukprot:CAMPEP_0194532156 /NCGR_PEP_ID=MMETSP0253-20130528/69669_1 /TAXON_ID=2966 /ORGANISM="Noctiluca scintillans" /LENGTH=61 /DNA_ID=CAMNT_0039377579 /DNA_START=1 /DNA_END=186 /DNA_ORIENTATION=-
MFVRIANVGAQDVAQVWYSPVAETPFEPSNLAVTRTNALSAPSESSSTSSECPSWTPVKRL